jgi:hypothetical protein
LIDTLSEEEVKTFLEDEKAVEAENQTMVVEFRKQFDIIRNNLLTFLDAGSSEYKYVNKLSSWTSPPSYKDLLVESREKRAWSRKQKEVLAKTEESVSSLRDEAICLLIENGKKYGVEFNADNAIDRATQLVFNEKTAEYAANGQTVYISSLCSEFDKWDGVSNRCSCGNRRMY